MTTNFYAPPSAFRASHVDLPEEEAHHAHSVLRVEAGDVVSVVDGDGGWYRVEVTHASASPARVVGTILEMRRDVGEPGVEVTLGAGLLKNRDRFETLAEKATEVGVRRIVPLRTAHTETETLRRERVRNVMLAAMKQCRRSRLPTLASPQSLVDFLHAADTERRFICHGGTDAGRLQAAVRRGEGTPPTDVLVGPEGGFTNKEVKQAVETGCRPVSLGARRLRAETAGIVAVHTVVQAGRGAG